ncbi:uncharacterized protein LOC142985120 [Anticarsia gemmatalis]|uniref:uncharacterized protein LOC142985120 n=1 Tax=Anticarsia gemmatalis TaxID=129554 RepID=UPI003F7748E3
MQTTIKKSSESKTKKEKSPPKEESPKPQDDKNKKSYNSTPRNYLQKTTTADIYGQKKRSSVHSAKAPKKSLNSTNITSNESPMKNLLKSSSSSTSVSSTREKSKMAVQKKVEAKASKHTASKAKDFNVTVNSPVVKKKLYLDKEKSFVKEVSKREKDGSKMSSVRDLGQKVSVKSTGERQRTKTRTLDENEVKILTPEAVDNNVEMLNLSKRLSAKPKAYFIDLEDSKAVQIERRPRPKTPSDEEVSYEDDFESYESDFDSYHSSSPSEHSDDKSDDKSDGDEAGDKTEEVETKEVKDDERMLDSGSFDLRDQRSATKTKPVLDFILETSEGGMDKPSSLTDEGFQEMSSSSAVSSIRTVHVDVLDRPIFIDFKKSKENKRKKRINEQLKQRAKDLLSIITLHEMSYSLFEMKPISYDLYMATFGRTNYQQIAVQTFEDSITEEVQTDEVELTNKWTQHPVEFSDKDICIINSIDKRKYSINSEDYLTKFTFLTTQSLNVQLNNEINEDYKRNPLRIYFEQKHGVGPSEMLPFENYKSKLKNNDFITQRLGRFLKKIENRICNVLNINSGDTEMSELRMTNLPFSKGYVSISTKNIIEEKISFLNNIKISKMLFSTTKHNLIMTVHEKAKNIKKCTICLWDIGVARREPLKILTAIDNIAIGRFRGATDGIFIAALEDGSIHLWDLSEEPTWRDITSEDKSKELVEVAEGNLTAFERDREWNLKNSQVGLDECYIHCALQACAFTNSANNMSSGDVTNNIVGLEFTGDQTPGQEGRRVIGQVVALQRTGILTIWSIIQEKTKTIPPDIGKAFWSKMKLEKYQTINIFEHIDTLNTDNKPNFNINSAKKRLQNKKQEKNIIKNSRPKSAMSFDSDRPTSAASVKNKKVSQVNNVSGWECGVICYDLKVVNLNNSDSYLIGKNCGEVLCCKRILGAVRVDRLCLATDASSVICIEVSPHGLPYYLAATDAGTISVCSVLENRVLLTLDCRNIPNQEVQKCQSDHKGRFISTVSTKQHSFSDSHIGKKLKISSVSWSHINPCCIFATLDGSIVSWELSHSDIYAKCASDDAAISCIAGDTTLALLTTEGDVHIHKLTNENKTKEYLKLFEKYVALL